MLKKSKIVIPWLDQGLLSLKFSKTSSTLLLLDGSINMHIRTRSEKERVHLESKNSGRMMSNGQVV